MRTTHVVAVAAIAAVTGAGAAYAAASGLEATPPPAATAPVVEQQEDPELHRVGYRKWAVIDAYRGHTGTVFPGRADFYSDIRVMLAEDPDNDLLCTLANAADGDPADLLMFMEGITRDAPGTHAENLTFTQALVDHCAEADL